MSLELLKQSIKDKMVGALVLAVVFFILILYVGAMYPEIKKMSGLEDLMSNPAIKAFLGSEGMALASYAGLMKTYLSIYWGLVMGGFVAFAASAYYSGEIERKTSELMLSLPISRVKFVLTRYMAMIPLIVGVAIAVILAMFSGAVIVGETLPLEWMLWLGVIMIAFALAVASIGTLISAMLSDSKQALLLTLGMVILMYFMQTLGSTLKGLEWLGNLSLFTYMDMGDILIRHTVNYADIGVLLGVAVIALGLAVFAFNRRDINVS